MMDRKKWVKWLRDQLKYHKKESEKLSDAGSFAASRWEDGYVSALQRILDRIHRTEDR